MIDIQKELEDLTLYSGDMLIDSVTSSIGVLIECVTESDSGPFWDSDQCIEIETVYWKVFWVTGMESNIFGFTGLTHMEEYGLKMSIVIGIYDYYRHTKE
tara:strand:- start:3948 stop:4247 length:300 start_codon:yes stop_codon:yes gene_type:complete